MKKLTEYQIQQARNCPNEYGAATDLAKQLGISVQHVCAIRLGRTCRKDAKLPGRPRTNDDKVQIRCNVSKKTFEILETIDTNIANAITHLTITYENQE